jgi:hypothetical protein
MDASRTTTLTERDAYECVTLQDFERECRLSGADFFALLISGRTELAPA